MSFIAYCYRCERKVTAHTKLGDAELLSALTSDAPVEVGHISDGDGDHSWKLNKEEREHLLKEIRRRPVKKREG